VGRDVSFDGGPREAEPIPLGPPRLDDHHGEPHLHDPGLGIQQTGDVERGFRDIDPRDTRWRSMISKAAMLPLEGQRSWLLQGMLV